MNIVAIKHNFEEWAQEFRHEQGHPPRQHAIARYYEEVVAEKALQLVYNGATNEVIGDTVRQIYGLMDECQRNHLLYDYESQLDAALLFNEPTRSRFLSNIMSDMERSFGIPMINNEQFNTQNPHVMALYRRVSCARDL